MGLGSESAKDGGAPEVVGRRRQMSIVSGRVLADSVVRLSPTRLVSNPVMLIVEITFFIVAAMAVYPQGFVSVASVSERLFYVEIAIILLITVWFSTLSDSLAEQQAKNTASSLRKLEAEVPSKKVVRDGWTQTIMQTSSKDLRKGDLILLEKGDLVGLDSEVLEGIAMIDESLLTGESAPVKKAPGDVLIGGSRVVSDTLTARVTANPGETYVDQMIRMVESSKRPKTPNEQAVTMVLIGLTAIFTIIIGSLLGLSITLNLGADLSVLIALYVCLLPTTIGALLPAIGLSGISRLYLHKIIAKSGKAIETAGDADVILLDKTGTITVGDRRAIQFLPISGTLREGGGRGRFPLVVERRHPGGAEHHQPGLRAGLRPPRAEHARAVRVPGVLGEHPDQRGEDTARDGLRPRKGRQVGGSEDEVQQKIRERERGERLRGA